MPGHIWCQVRDRLPHLKMIVQYSSEPLDSEQQEQGVVPWREFLEIGKVCSVLSVTVALNNAMWLW